MKKLALLLTMLPFCALADVPRPMRLDDLGVSSLLLVYWTVLAFATGLSIALWKFRSSMEAVVMLIVTMIFGVLGVVMFNDGMFGVVGWLFFRCGIPVAAAMFVLFVLINKVCQRRWKRWLMILPLVVMTVWCLFGFPLFFVACRTCESKGVIRWYNMGHQCAECNCCKGMRCHLRWGHVKCVEPISGALSFPVSEKPSINPASQSANKRFVQQESASDGK